MSDDLNKTIKQITDILGQENMPDNVKALLSLLASGSEKSSAPEHPASAAREEAQEDKNDRVSKIPQPEKSGSGFDNRMVRKAMELMNTRDDPKVNLLMAIKPFLNNSRQKNLNNCIKIANITKVLSLLDEFQDGKD